MNPLSTKLHIFSYVMFSSIIIHMHCTISAPKKLLSVHAEQAGARSLGKKQIFDPVFSHPNTNFILLS